MTVTAFPYIIKSATGSYNTEINGYDFVVTIILKGIEGANDVAQLYAALTDSNIPLAGSDLSGVDEALTGCWNRKIDAVALGDGEFEVTCTYQQSQWGILQVDVGSQLSQIETTNNLFGVPVELFYTYPSDYGGTDPNAEQLRLRGTGELKQGGTVTVLKPESSRIYTVRQDIDPDLQQRSYEGTVNDFTWWFGAARTWLCTSITGTSDNSGVLVDSPTVWVNRYEFQYRSGGWDPEAVYSDDLTGEPVPDPVEGDGIYTVPSYNQTDFTEMFAGS